MVTRTVDEVDLAFVQHKLDGLAAARLMLGWSVLDENRYQEFAELEESLLLAQILQEYK